MLIQIETKVLSGFSLSHGLSEERTRLTASAICVSSLILMGNLQISILLNQDLAFQNEDISEAEKEVGFKRMKLFHQPQMKIFGRSVLFYSFNKLSANPEARLNLLV